MKLISPAPTINGIFCVIEACATQKALPATDIISMYMETSSVWRVLNALTIWGTRISVHSDEAIQPNKTSIVTKLSLIDVSSWKVGFFHVAGLFHVFAAG